MAGKKRAVEDPGLCECCLTDYEDEVTGVKCYQQARPRQHRLLWLAVDEEVARSARWKGCWSRDRAGRSHQLKDTPPPPPEGQEAEQ